MNNNDNNKGWLFFGGYKYTLPSILKTLHSSSTRAILLTSRAIYSCIPPKLKAIQYYIIIEYHNREHKLQFRYLIKQYIMNVKLMQLNKKLSYEMLNVYHYVLNDCDFKNNKKCINT